MLKIGIKNTRKHPSSNFISFLCFSLFLHLMLFLSLKYYHKPMPTSDVKPSIKSFKVELKQEPAEQPPKKFSLRDLMPSSVLSQENLNKKDLKKSNLHKTKETIKSITFYKRLWDKVESKLSYPGVFNANEIYGDVQINLRFKQNGTLDSHFLQTSSANEHLSSYVKLIILKSFEKPLHHKFWHKESRLHYLKFYFEFDLRKNPNTGESRLGAVNNTSLSFYRKRYNPSMHPLKKALPILGGGGMVDLVEVYNILSGQKKRNRIAQKKALRAFKKENDQAYKQFHKRKN